MNERLRLAGLALAMTSVLVVTSLWAATIPAGAADHQSLHGTFAETAAGEGLGYDIHGSAKLTVAADSTVADVNIAGLDPTKHYGSHVHNGTCAAGGGGHYQNVVSTTLVTPPNELWLTTSDNPVGGVDPNPGGVAHANGSAAWEARLTTTATNARSIIVHQPVTGARIACADLS